MKFLPRTLFGQLALALFAGLLVVQLAGLWLLLDDRGREVHRLQRDRGGCTVSGWREGDEDEDPRLFYAATSRDEAWRSGKTWAEAQAKESGHG